MKKQVTIIGAGIAGLTTAIALNKIGVNTLIYEASPTIKGIGAGLVLSANAIIAFSRLGIMEEVIQCGRILPSFLILDQKGKQISRTNSKRISTKYGVDNFAIHRGELHRLLLSKLDSSSIHADKKAIDIEQKINSVTVKFEDDSTLETEFLVAADGIHSAIRKKLLPFSRPRYAGYTCWRAIIDNDLLDLTESSETWGTNGRFGVVPLTNSQVYWFACINAPQNDSKLKNYSIKDLLHHFKEYHEPIPAILSETQNTNLLWNDIIDLKPIDKYAFGNIILIGDAAHATTPNMGQGACQAIEDAIVLSNELSKNVDFKEAFKNFEKRRIRRTHSIANLSWYIGKIAQLDNRLLVSLRNFVFRLIPERFNETQLKRLYKVDF